MKKLAGSGKRFLIVGLGTVGAALVVPAHGATDAGADTSSLGSDAGTGGMGGGSGAAGSGGGVAHGTDVRPTGCAVAGQREEGGGAAGVIGLGLTVTGLMAGNRRRRPVSE